MGKGRAKKTAKSECDMGCNHSKTLEGDTAPGGADLSAADLEAVRRLSGVSGGAGALLEDEDEGDLEGMVEGGGSRFGGIARRDSIRINKNAIEKRKKNVAGEGGKVREGMRRPLPRAFMKPGEKNTATQKGGRFGKASMVRRDSIRVNKEKMDRKKKHRASVSSGTGLPAGMKVEVVPATPPTGKLGKKSIKQMATANPAHE